MYIREKDVVSAENNSLRMAASKKIKYYKPILLIYIGSKRVNIAYSDLSKGSMTRINTQTNWPSNYRKAWSTVIITQGKSKQWLNWIDDSLKEAKDFHFNEINELFKIIESVHI